MNAAYLTPAITLFNEDGTLDLASQERLFNNLIDQGVDGILVEGSSSEFFAMPMNQRREMAKFAIEKIDHRVKLIIGTSQPGLRVVLVLAKRLKQERGRLVLCAMQPHVHEVFDISGFLAILDVQATRQEALARL